jgi:hypothetical protein
MGCDSRKFESTDPEFDFLVSSFQKDHKEFLNKDINLDVPINFSDIGDAAAHCYIYMDGKNEILVNKTLWTRFKDGSKKALIYHELGHCALGQKEHRNEYIKTKISSSMKASIMNEFATNTLRSESDSNFEVNEFYLYEFFHKDQSIWEQF